MWREVIMLVRDMIHVLIIRSNYASAFLQLTWNGYNITSVNDEYKQARNST